MAAVHEFVAAVYAAKWYIVTIMLCSYSVQYYISYQRLAHIKGPFLAAWTNFWLVRAVYNKNTHQELYDANKIYGSLARVGPNMLVTSDPGILHHMSGARSTYTKGAWYQGFRMQPGLDSVFTTIDEKEHTKRRAQMALGFSGKENPDVEKRIDMHMWNLINLIRSKYISTNAVFKPMDLARKAQFVTLDIITDLAFDVPFGDIDNDEDMHLYLQSTEEILPVAIILSTIPAIRNFLNIPLIGEMILPSSKDKMGPGRLIRIAEDVVKKRYKEDPTGKQMDMLGSFMRHGMKEVNAVTETILQIIAGSDTSATAIRATMLFIMTSPRVYHRLQTEIDNHVKITNLPPSQIISYKAAETLPYLQAVIREGMRIWVPAVGIIPKTTPPEGDTLNGIFVPGGTDIGYCAWGIARNTDVFGDDSEIFRPERWLEAQGEKLARMDRTVDLLFGYGKYQCLGQTIAWMELNKVFFELLRNFEWSIVDPTKPWKSACVALWLQKDLWVRVCEREEGM